MSDFEHDPFNAESLNAKAREAIEAARAMVPEGASSVDVAQALATIAVAESILALYDGHAAIYSLLDDRLKG